MAREILLTAEGKAKLEKELHELKTTGRDDIAEKIKVARSFGDLSENSEYDEAKNEQGKLEARIIELEETLRNAKIIDENEQNNETVHAGSKVTIKNLANGMTMTYRILGETEANPSAGIISAQSPIAKGLLGHKAGETVEIDVPAGKVSFEIVEIA